ncbi:MAG: mannose-1-phosphate guanylyltransferase [Longimicrobiales bacterium]
MHASTSSSTPEPAPWAVVLAGGIGSRFWPVSTPTHPKQLLRLAGDKPLIRQTIERIRPLVPAERIRIVAGEHLARSLLEAVPELAADNLMIEPAAKGTAAALAWAAWTIHGLDPDAVMISLHADHVIDPAPAFRELLRAAARAAGEHGRLFTIGARPTRPETGYGYIRPGEALGGTAGREVDRFVEKPSHDVAETYMREGFLWNTGIFVWTVDVLLEELERHTPEIAGALPLLANGDARLFFERVPTLSIDHGLLERSTQVGVIPATFDWDDVGAWDAVSRTRASDDKGNVAVGDSHLVESSDCIAWAEEGSVVLFGAHDLVVIRANGITFVAPRGRTPELKSLLERLPARLREPGPRES